MNPQLELHLQEFERSSPEGDDEKEDASETRIDNQQQQPALALLDLQLEQQSAAIEKIVETSRGLATTTTTTTTTSKFRRPKPKLINPEYVWLVILYTLAPLLLAVVFGPSTKRSWGDIGSWLLFGVFVIGGYWKMTWLVETYKDATRSYNQNDSFETIASETPIQVDDDDDDEISKQRRTCRLKVCQLLGSIGAPFLQEDHTDTKRQLEEAQSSNGMVDDEEPPCSSASHVCKDLLHSTEAISTINPSVWFSLVLQFAHANVQLIQTLDTAMELLKMGTALHLGATTKTAERVERALLGRQRRDRTSNKQPHRENATLQEASESLPVDDVPVSFVTLRSLVSHAMIAQADALAESMLPLFDDENDTTGHPVQSSMLGGLPSVVTLTWLRTSRQQLSELLSCALDELTATSCMKDAVNFQSKLANSVAVVEELQQHLKSSLGLDNEKHDGQEEQLLEVDAGKPTDSIQERVVQTQAQLRQLYVALGAMGDASTQRENVDVSEWWDRVNHLSQEVQNSLQVLDQEYFQPLEEVADGDENSEADDEKSPNRSLREQSYTVEANAKEEQHTPVVQKLTKTSVFSGKGALKPPDPKQRLKESQEGPQSSSSGQQSSAAALQRDPVAQHYLLSELRTRLQTLSLPEEEHEVNDLEDYEIVKSDPVPTNYTERTTAIPSFGGLLVGELSNAVKVLGNQSHSDDEESIVHS